MNPVLVVLEHGERLEVQFPADMAPVELNLLLAAVIAALEAAGADLSMAQGIDVKNSGSYLIAPPKLEQMCN